MRFVTLSLHLVTYYLIFISGTVIRTFFVIAAHKTIVFILIQIDITVIFIAFFIICIICTVFTASSFHGDPSSPCEPVFLPSVLPDYIAKTGRILLLKFFLFFIVLVRRIPQSAFTVSLYAMSEHCIHSFIFVKHLRMVLFLHLNVRQKFPYTAVLKIKYICIVFSRNKLLRSDTVCCKKSIMFLIL